MDSMWKGDEGIFKWLERMLKRWVLDLDIFKRGNGFKIVMNDTEGDWVCFLLNNR